MADRKTIMDGTMSALGLATAAAIVYLAPIAAPTSSAASQEGLTQASGSWTQMDQSPSMAPQSVNPQARSEQ